VASPSSSDPVPAFADLPELERIARTRLPDPVWEYAHAGADDGVTAAANIAAWGEIKLRPRVLRGVTAVDSSTTLLGSRVALPIAASPTGKQRLFHPEGELATARALAAAGALTVLSWGAADQIERVVSAAPGGLRWLQVYLERDRERTRNVVERAAAAGFRAVVVTVDLAPGGRPRVEGAVAGWAAPAGNVELEQGVGLDDLAWLRSLSPLPILVKGVLRDDDAHRCVEAGAAGVVVSNHGGNQLDTAVPTAEALPEVVAAVAGRAEVYVDGGIRRGTTVLKALAMGAQAVLVGRPIVCGLAVGGSAGVAAMLDCLARELRRAMLLCGAANLAELTPDLLAR
jgi:4-hydroxymandelate oxidase